MNALKFTLSGEFGFFKNADARSGRHFTYSHIHRVTVLGILGAVIGLDGYNTHQLKQRLGHETTFFPEFYEVFRDVKISVVPVVENPPASNQRYFSFAKQMEEFTDTTQFSNKDGTLMVREQWLRKPSWDIYVLLGDHVNAEMQEKLVSYVLESKSVYLPYIGKNNHFAVLSDPKVVELEQHTSETPIDSLFVAEGEVEDAIRDQEDDIDYMLLEFMPVGLNDQTGNYVFKKMTYTTAVLPLDGYWVPTEGRKILFH